jgi:hypothetical protein
MSAYLSLHMDPEARTIRVDAALRPQESAVLRDEGHGRHYLALAFTLGLDTVNLYTATEAQSERLVSSLEAACRDWRKQQARAMEKVA